MISKKNNYAFVKFNFKEEAEAVLNQLLII